MKGAFLAIYEKIKASIQHAINDDAEDWSIMPSDVAKEIDGGFKAYAEGLEEQVETLQAEQSAFMQTQAQTLAEHVFDETQHLTQAQVNEIAKIEGKVDKTDFKDHLEDDERHLTFSDRVEIDSVKDKASAEDLQRHISNPDVHYPIEVTQEYTDVAIDKAKAELLEVIAQGGSASVDLSGVIDRISDVEGALTAHENNPSIHFKIEETKVYADAKLHEAKAYADSIINKPQVLDITSNRMFVYRMHAYDLKDKSTFTDAIAKEQATLQVTYVSPNTDITLQLNNYKTYIAVGFVKHSENQNFLPVSEVAGGIKFRQIHGVLGWYNVTIILVANTSA